MTSLIVCCFADLSEISVLSFTDYQAKENNTTPCMIHFMFFPTFVQAVMSSSDTIHTVDSTNERVEG